MSQRDNEDTHRTSMDPFDDMRRDLRQLRNDMADVKERMAAAAATIQQVGDLTTKVEKINESMIELRTKFAVVWGVMALIGTTAGAALVTALMKAAHP